MILRAVPINTKSSGTDDVIGSSICSLPLGKGSVMSQCSVMRMMAGQDKGYSARVAGGDMGVVGCGARIWVWLGVWVGLRV